MTPLKPLVGAVPSAESKFKGRMRFHQGWWRAFVLNRAEGPNPSDPSRSVCNTVADGAAQPGNFLTDRAAKAVDATLAGRGSASVGLIDERRLRSNLLSSQPLAFNFFGHLADDLELATRLLMPLFGVPDAQVTAIHFEYAPGRPAGDNSAFDAAVEYTRQGRRGLVGIECKYTDTFSAKEYKSATYLSLHGASQTFSAPYETLCSSRYNQLFRNQLVGEGLRLRKDDKFDEVHVRLFCSPTDSDALATGENFRAMVNASATASFAVVTYEHFIAAAQQLPLAWPDREWTMLLWARYCALCLSDRAYGEP